MNPEKPISLRFWGVRGSTPVPESGNLGYGGNTSCIEVQCGDEAPLIFDAGTGARALGMELARSSNHAPICIFLTHFHWDHIQGIPFFTPLFMPGRRVRFYSACSEDELRHALEGQLRGLYFPARGAVQAELQYLNLPEHGCQFGGLVVKPFPLSHPGQAAGYSIKGPSGSILYVSDHEHGNEAIDGSLREHARGADVLIYDAQYTPEEYNGRRGWGHSTWLEATRIARDADVRQLILFHHDPQHDDEAVAVIAAEARSHFENTIAAREGLTITL